MQQNRLPLIIGVTGLIGSGKTTFCDLIARHYPVYYADELAHQVLAEKDIQDLLTQNWGHDILQNGVVERKLLAKIVFRDKTKLAYLNSLIHPKVMQKMQIIVNSSTSPYLFFEVPLLFEEHLEACFDHIVLITASMENMLERISQRTGMTQSEFRLRVDQLLPEQYKAELADTQIDNNGSLEDLSEKVELLSAILKGCIKKLHNLLVC